MAQKGCQDLAGQLYCPPPHVQDHAHVKEYAELYQPLLEDPQGFWAERAQELEGFQPWSPVLDDWDRPFCKWFVDGPTNIVYDALDRHLKTHRKNKLALIGESEKEETRSFSYFDLNREVCQFANVLKSLGVTKGAVVTIYMPRIPEQMIAMLARAEIGAAHSVVYGGFSVEALAERIEDAQSKVLIRADGSWSRGNTVNLEGIVDEAVGRQPTIQVCLVVRRTGQEIRMESGRDYWYHDLMNLPIASPVCLMRTGMTRPVCACSDPWGSRSTPRPGRGTASVLRRWKAHSSAIRRSQRLRSSAFPTTSRAVPFTPA